MRRPTRTQVYPVLVALGCVLVAAAMMRLSEPAEDFDVSAAVVGRAAPLYGGELTVTAVRAGSRLSYGDPDEVLTSPGMFVVLDVSVDAGTEKLTVGSYELRSGDHLYKPYQSMSSLAAPPGYRATGSVVFEVDPAHIDDLTATLGRTEIFHGYQQKVVLPVGITGGNAEAWRASAAGRLLTVAEYPESRPVP